MKKVYFLPFKNVITTIVLLLSSSILAAQPEETVISSGIYTGTSWNTLNTLTVGYTPATLPSSMDINVRYRVRLKINQTLVSFFDKPFSAEIQFNIEGSTGSGSSPITIETGKTMTVTYDKRELKLEKDEAVYELDPAASAYSSIKLDNINIHSVTFPGIANPVDAGGHPITVNDPVFAGLLQLELEVVYQRYELFSPTSFFTPSSASYTLDVPTNSLHITWPPMNGAVEYDLEWQYIDDYGNSGSSFNPSVSFFKNAARITTKSLSYNLPLVYEQGYLVFRLRPKGYAILNNPQSYTFGIWSNESSITIGSLQDFMQSHWGYHLLAPHENDKFNWQVSSIFSEEAKRKDVVSYHDGLGYKRQSVTLVNNENALIGMNAPTKLAVVGEEFYDHLGRTALTAMSAPSNDAILNFHRNFNQNMSGLPYDKSDFDFNNSAACNQFVGAMSHQNNGASYYFSKNNPFLNSNSYNQIPDAEDYPFFQVQFTGDATGRVSLKGAVGKDYQLGKGHETKTFYDKPSQKEIDALFGNNVGDASHYNRISTINPDGQASIEYKDVSGKTIASCLAGDSPKSVEVLESNQGAVIALDDINSTVDINTYCLNADQSFTVLKAGTNTFEYSLELPLNEQTCFSHGNVLQNICFDCVYDLEITIVRNDGCQEVVFPPSGSNKTVVHKVGHVLGRDAKGELIPDVSCHANNIVFPAIANANPITLNLEVGSYTISKKLCVNQEVANAYAKFYVSDSIDNTCMFSYQHFLDQAIHDIDTTQCHTDHCNPNALPSSPYYCNTEVDQCKSSRMMLLADMTPPSGQYARMHLDANGHYIADDLLSFFNTNNQLKPSAHVDYTQVTFFESDGVTVSTWRDPSDGLSYPINHPVHRAPLDYIVNHWIPNWTENILNYHPESCMLGFCDTKKEYFEFQGNLMRMSYQNAVTNGFTGISNSSPYLLFYADPLFTSNSAPFTVTTSYAPIDQAFRDLMQAYIDDIYMSAANTTPTSLLDAAISFVYYKYHQTLTVPPAILSLGLTDPVMGPEIWTAYKGLYITKRQIVLDFIRNDYALHQFCFNGCIGNSGYSSAYATFPSYTNPLLAAHLCDPNVSISEWESHTPRFGIGEDAAHHVNPALSPTIYFLTVTDLHSVLPLFAEPPTPPNVSIPTQYPPAVVHNQSILCPDNPLPGSPVPPNCQHQMNKDIESFFDAFFTYLHSTPNVSHLNLNSNTNFSNNGFYNQLKSTNGVYFNVSNNGKHILIGNEPCSIVFDLPSTFINQASVIGVSNVDVALAPNGTTFKIDQICFDIDYANAPSSLHYCFSLANRCSVNSWCDSTVQLCDPMVFTDLDDTNQPIIIGASTGCSLCDVQPHTIQVHIPTCVEVLMQIARSNALNNYQSYRRHVYDSVRTAYLNKCLTAIEHFSRSYDDLRHHFTLFYYDQSGSLVMTVPPAGVNKINDPNLLNQIENSRHNSSVSPYYPTHELVSQTQYNSLSNPLWAQSPDAGIQNAYFDVLGRLVCSQNSKQLIENKTSYTLFDELGRTIESGELAIPINNIPLFSNGSVDYLSYLTQLQAGNYPKLEYVKSVYDESLNNVIPTYFTNGQNNLRGRLSSMQYFGYDVNNNLNTSIPMNAIHYSYDVHGSVTELINDFDGWINGFRTKVENKFDLISGKVKLVEYQKGKPDQFVHKYLYDGDNKIVEVYTTRDEGRIWHRDAEYLYYAHGALSRTELGRNRVQGLDYVANLQGWLKSVNSPTLNPIDDPNQDSYLNARDNRNVARDAIGYVLRYNDTDYKSITGFTPEMDYSQGGFQWQPEDNLYNGNIRGMVTAIRPFMNIQYDALGVYNLYRGLRPSDTGPLETHYVYDQLQRLNGMYTNKGSINKTWLSDSNNDWDIYNNYNESYTYDGNGNILSLNRNGVNDAAIYGAQYHVGQSVEMDKLQYNYTPGTNQLSNLNDGVTTSNYSGTVTYSVEDLDEARDYQYDPIGQLIREDYPANAGTTITDWNFIHKVKSVSIFENNPNRIMNISFAYSPTGNRIVKNIKKQLDDNSLQGKITIYSYDGSGNIMGIYESSASKDSYGDKLKCSSLNIYGIKRLGQVHPDTIIGGLTLNNVAFVFDASPEGRTADPNNPDIKMNNPGISIRPGVEYYNQGGTRQYELSNQLGNILATITDKKIPQGDRIEYAGNVLISESTVLTLSAGFFETDIVSASDYYPYGMEMPGRVYHAENYRFGFNGKENDNEMKGNGNSLDFGARLYDPRVGRWLSVDLMKAKYAAINPYHFGLNNPVNIIDHDGNQGTHANDDFYFNTAGDLIGIIVSSDSRCNSV